MKTFDQLFDELSAKVAAGDPASGTVTAVRDGVHAAGKKVVEEAAESWMAAEHEGEARTAATVPEAGSPSATLPLSSANSSSKVFTLVLPGPGSR